MCVIMLIHKDGPRPSKEMVERAWNANSDGAGIAWRADYNGAKHVFWKKGLESPEEVFDLTERLPGPYVVHFRVASIGGVSPELTHPFPVQRDVPLALEGRTRQAVLFHNGHWGDWNQKVLDSAISAGVRIPQGDWSDTRGMAFLVHQHGPAVMELLTTQKGVYMTPSNMQIFTGPGWDKVNGIWCSNDYFVSRGRAYSGSQNYNYVMCAMPRCTDKRIPGKDICEKCDKARKAAAAEIAGSTGVTTTEPKKEGTISQNAAASSGNPTTNPTTTGDTNDPFAGALTLQQVEALHLRSKQLVSKSMLKKYRKASSQLGRGGNPAARANKTISKLVKEITERLAEGN